MAHHKSAQKRIRQTSKRRMDNRYYGKTTRNAIRKFETLEDKKEAAELMPTIVSMVDKLAKRNQIHKNTAANMKSSIMKHLNALK
jgi:small subunit ribosomal protein S20